MRRIIVVLGATVCGLAMIASRGFPQQRAKFRGYITELPAQGSLRILEDVIAFDQSTRFEVENAPPGKGCGAEDLTVGTLIEAQGTWRGRHLFAAEKITCDWSQSVREIEGEAYIDQEPPQLKDVAGGSSALWRVDGEILVVGQAAKLSSALTQNVAANTGAPAGLAGKLVHYRGVRQPDGMISVSEVELGVSRPADAFEVGEGIKVVRAQDEKTKIEILEFRKGKNVLGRMKLFPVKEVQNYVEQLAEKLLPANLSKQTTGASPEFRFYVIEDASVNAAALPDGTVLVNTGLLGAVEDEAQLAFVLGHEIAHVVQVHHWRQVHETRKKRVLLAIAGAAASGFIGDLGNFLAQLGIMAVWNGYSRALENQADRLGLETMIDLGYDPRQAPRFSQLVIDRYGDRSTSALWSNHDSSVLRGSFLTVQILRQYPRRDFSKAIADTPAFRAMRDAMGPVKVM